MLCLSFKVHFFFSYRKTENRRIKKSRFDQNGIMEYHTAGMQYMCSFEDLESPKHLWTSDFLVCTKDEMDLFIHTGVFIYRYMKFGMFFTRSAYQIIC